MAEGQVQAQTQTVAPAGTPVPVARHSFGLFAIVVALLIILAIFCVVYLSVRKKVEPRHVDDKAGDEGEDT